jgi:hypothetical protein
MSPRRFFVPVAASLWAHLSLVVLAAMTFPELLPDPVDSGEEQAGAHTELDGRDLLGEALEELVPVGLDVIDAVAELIAPPPPLVPPAPVPVPDPPVAASAAEPLALPAAAPVEASPVPLPRRPVRAVRPRGSVAQRKSPGPPCEVPSEIESVGDHTWALEREIVEYYAMNLDELMKQASVWTHKDKAGKADGFRLGLSRCSVGKAAGLRNGDIVHRINDRKITSIPQAIAAYFDLRDEPELSVDITRSGKQLTLYYRLEQPGRKELREIRKATRKGIREQAERKG